MATNKQNEFYHRTENLIRGEQMSTQVAIIDTVALVDWSDENIQLLKDTVAKGTTDNEFRLFLHVCQSSGLDPFRKQIYCIKRWDKNLGRDVAAYQTSIDGFRIIAEMSGQYLRQTAPEWCGKDGKWLDVWVDDKPPHASRVGVVKIAAPDHPVFAVAYWSMYAAYKKDSSLAPFWKKGGPHMLAKCAEALALRKAFPNQLSGLYTADEMQQASPTVEIPAHVLELADALSVTTEQVLKVYNERRADWGANRDWGKVLARLQQGMVAKENGKVEKTIEIEPDGATDEQN